jgi:hypothetical protein
VQVLKAVPYLAVVVVQDALELAEDSLNIWHTNSSWATHFSSKIFC